MPNVSVVVPVYNVGSYLRECLDSLVGQTLTDIEIIGVNDGSTDGSDEILREYAQRDARIMVLEQSNQGVSAARNRGAERASGDYLYFLDGDDYLSTHALETLHARATADALDVLLFGATAIYSAPELEAEHPGYRSYYLRKSDYPGIMSGRELLVAMTQNRDWRPSVPLQFLRTQAYRELGLSFYEGILHEDNLFSFQWALRAQRVGYLAESLYCRRVRHNSIMTVSKDVDNFHGFVVSYLEMLRTTFDLEIDTVTSPAVASVMSEVYRQAASVYRGLSDDERSAAEPADDTPEALTVLAEIKADADEFHRWQAGRERLEQSLAACEKRCARLERDLEKKSAKLEKQTEKLDRQTEKLERIRSSRSFKLASAIRRLFRPGR